MPLHFPASPFLSPTVTNPVPTTGGGAFTSANSTVTIWKDPISGISYMEVVATIVTKGGAASGNLQVALPANLASRITKRYRETILTGLSGDAITFAGDSNLYFLSPPTLNDTAVFIFADMVRF